MALAKRACAALFRWFGCRKSSTCGKCVAALFTDNGGLLPILILRSSPNPPPCVSNKFLKVTPARQVPFYWLMMTVVAVVVGVGGGAVLLKCLDIIIVVYLD